METNNPYAAKTTRRKWTPEETKQFEFQLKQGKTTKELAKYFKRSEASIANKRRRLLKKKGKGNYGKTHQAEKEKYNSQFVQYIQPRNVLDVYNGGNTQYSDYNPVTNDIDPSFNTTYHMDAYELMCYMVLTKKKYDFIDIDPFGSPYELIDIAFKLINTHNPKNKQRGGGYV